VNIKTGETGKTKESQTSTKKETANLRLFFAFGVS
jgi:hypothetical protein